MKGTNMHKELIDNLWSGCGNYSEIQDRSSEAANAIEVLEDKLKQEKETNLNHHNKLMKVLSEKVTLQAELERLTPLQFRQAPCRRFCESTAYEIHIKQLKAACEVALEALKTCYDVDSYPANGKTPQDYAITKLQGALQ
jgi:hypothetical protein